MWTTSDPYFRPFWLSRFLLSALLCLPAHARTTFWVSPAGSDVASGSLTQPFRTLQRAQEAVRQVIQDGMTGDVTVFVGEGTYYLDAPLRFDERDSGRDGFRVFWKGRAGEMARIVGGRRLQGWKKGEGSLYVAELGPDWQPNALLENGEPADLARTPNQGYLAVEAAVPDPERPRLTYRKGDLPARFEGRGAQVLVWAGYDELWDGGKNYNWEATLQPVAEIDFETRCLTLAGPTIRDLHAHNRYYVRGALEFLDQPGEFWTDRENGLLYYWPRATPIEEQEIVASTTPRLLEIVGSEAATPAENLVFENLTLELSSAPDAFGPSMYLACDGLVYISRARGVTVRNCRIRGAGLAGVALHLDSREHTIADNLIEECGYSGVCAGGYWIGGAPYADEVEAYVNRDHLVTRNHIRRCGRLIGHASGVWLYQSGDNTVSRNLIEEMPRYGIRMDGNSFWSLINPQGLGGRLFGKAVTWENHLDFIYTRNNRIIANQIRHCMQDSQDGGGIGAYGTGTGNLIARNFVHHLSTSATEGSIAGIYLDDACNQFIVESNIVARLAGCRYVYPLIIKGCDHVIQNNILADNEAAAAVYVLQTPYGGLPQAAGHPEEPVDRLRFRRNLIVRSGQVIYQIYPWKDTILAESDENLLFRPEAGYGCVIDWKWETWADWTKRLDGKYERRTLLEDPQFVEAERMDYRLKPTSPALRVGFQPIEGMPALPGNDRRGRSLSP